MADHAGGQVRRKCREGCATLSRSVFNVVVPGLVALIVAAIVPSAVSAASCRLNDPTLLRKIEYGGIYDNAVTLRDGICEGMPFVPGGASRPRVELLDMPPLDGDGIDEAAVLLAETSGGSGAFAYLAIVSCRDARAVNVGTIGLGDRVMIRSMAGQKGAIVVEFVVVGLGEPLCCPTRKVRNTYRLRGEKLLLASAEEQGILSLTDVKGVTWRLSRLGRNERVPDDVKVTAMFEDGRVSGTGGGFEDRYFSALQTVNQFGFLLGNLVLHYEKGAERETMIFEREVPRVRLGEPSRGAIGCW
jgi:hypothetical protein